MAFLPQKEHINISNCIITFEKNHAVQSISGHNNHKKTLGGWTTNSFEKGQQTHNCSNICNIIFLEIEKKTIWCQSLYLVSIAEGKAWFLSGNTPTYLHKLPKVKKQTNKIYRKWREAVWCMVLNFLLCTHSVHSSEDNASGDQSMRLKALKELVSRPLCWHYFLTPHPLSLQLPETRRAAWLIKQHTQLTGPDIKWIYQV